MAIICCFERISTGGGGKPLSFALHNNTRRQAAPDGAQSVASPFHILAA